MPTLLRLADAEPLGMPAAFFSRSVAGGVLSVSVKELSWKMVISTGIMLPDQVGRLGVVLLAEAHDVHAMLAQSRTNRRRRIGLACRNLQPNDCFDLFCHALTSNLLPIGSRVSLFG